MIRALFLLLLVGSTVSIQGQSVIDTVYTLKGRMIIYANKTWEFVDVSEFDGILNKSLDKLISKDPTLNYKQSWDNNVCFTSERKNDLGKLKDTLWLCVNDDENKDFHIPFNGIVSSRYGLRKGRNHNGIDIALNVGDTVKAAWSGKVRYAKFNEGGFGNLVIIRHYNGLESFYAHLSKHLCVPNQDVVAGEPIGLGGNTGHSFGAHLHFEIRFYDEPINPEAVIDFEKMLCKDQNLLIHKGLFKSSTTPTNYNESAITVKKTTTKAVPVRPVYKYHKVKPGDTLTSIATKNHTTISKICQLNGIKQSSSIQIGRSLRVK